jgi:hypothetical protein
MGTTFVAGENVKDAWKLLTLQPLKGSLDSRYVDCTESRGTNISRKLYGSLQLHSSEPSPMHVLLTGYRGDGKTTELFQFMNLIAEEYRPLYFNAEIEFDLLDFRLPDFLLGVARAVYDRMQAEGLPLPSDLVNEIADWFAKTVEVVERKESTEIKAEGGAGTPSWFPWITARLVGTIRAGGEKRREVRRELNQNLAQLIQKTDRLVGAAASVSKDKDGKELVLVYDSLDRLTPELAFDLFQTNGSNLKRLRCHSVYVVPISLRYQPQAPSLVFDEVVEMPMIAVTDREGKANSTNVQQLSDLLRRRFVPEKIMTHPEQTLETLIMSSGGHMRDLMRMCKAACGDALSEPDAKISPKVVERVVNSQGDTYLMAVLAEDEPALVTTHRTKAAENNDRTQRLIFNTVILVYDDNGVKWQDVHPALVASPRFQELLRNS